MLSPYGVDWNYRVTRLMEVGLNFAEATRWADNALYESTDALVRQAELFLAHGFNGAEAFWWWFYCLPVDVAIDFANAGWHPKNVEHLYEMFTDPRSRDLRSHLPADCGHRPNNAYQWLRTGLPDHRCILYATAGCSPAEALDLEARRRSGENTDPGLRVLAALRAPTP